MSSHIEALQKITVDGIGTFSAHHSLTVGAVDKLEITVPADDGTPGAITANVQPGTQVRCILIKTDTYDTDLTFDVAGAGSQPLDGPVLLCGTGPVALLNNAPTTISFENSRPEPADVTIVVGRDI